MNIPFDNTYAQLPERFFAKQEPARVPEPTLIRLNRELAVQLSIDTDWLESSSGVAMLAGNALPIFRDPHQVNFEVRFRVRSMAIPAHATTLPRSSLRLKARGFDHPRRGH